MKYTQESLYQLTPQEFELLCSQVITKILPSLENIKLNDMTYREVEVDILGTINGETVVVEVKHKLRMNSQEIKRIVDRLYNSPYHPKHIIVMTSALLSDVDLKEPYGKVGITCHYIGANDILQVLNTSSYKSSQLQQADKRSKLEKLLQIFSLLAMIMSSVGIFSLFYESWSEKKRAPLETKIATVENALGSLKGLENQLKDIKEDMIQKQKATELMNQEYKKAEELKKLTDTQQEAIKSALQIQSIREIIIQNLLSFIVGVASSIFATIIINKYRRRQALKGK